MKKAFLLLFVLVMVFTTSTIALADETIKVATIMVTNNDWALTLANGGELKAQEYGWEHITLNPENDIQKQIDLVESCISQGINAIYIQSVDSVAIIPVLEKALNAGIYIFADGEVEKSLSEYPNAYFASYDHVTAGQLCAKAVAEAIGNEGKVGIIAGLAGANNTIRRSEGFRNYFTDNNLNIDVVNEINCNWDRALAMSAAEDMIMANPDLKAIYSMGEEMAWGVVEAVEASGKDIKVITIDASQRTVQMVMDGRMYAAIGCPPRSFTGIGFDIYKTILDGGEVTEHIYDVPATYITKENASMDLADY